MPIKSHGSGRYRPEQFARWGRGAVIEEGVLVFHPENIEIGDDVYIGHNTILKGYHDNKMVIGSGTWIGPQCFFHSAGDLAIGCDVGIGPAVKIITSFHELKSKDTPILKSKVCFSPVRIEDNCDIGLGAIILPGKTIGAGAQVGAGAVITKDVEAYSVVAGNPAELIRMR